MKTKGLRTLDLDAKTRTKAVWTPVGLHNLPSPGSAASRRWRWILRGDDLGAELTLRKVLWIQSHDERSASRLCTRAKRIVSWIGRYLGGGADFYELGFFAQQVDQRPDDAPANAKPRQHRFVFGENLFCNKPVKPGMVEPVSEELGTRRNRRPFLEGGDSRHYHRGVYDAPTLGAFRRQR